MWRATKFDKNSRLLHIENLIDAGWVLRLQQRNSYVVDRDAARSFSCELAVMCMTMDHEVCSMAIDHLGESRRSQECIDFGGHPFYRRHNRRVMQHNDSLL